MIDYIFSEQEKQYAKRREDLLDKSQKLKESVDERFAAAHKADQAREVSKEGYKIG